MFAPKTLGSETATSTMAPPSGAEAQEGASFPPPPPKSQLVTLALQYYEDFKLFYDDMSDAELKRKAMEQA